MSRKRVMLLLLCVVPLAFVQSASVPSAESTANRNATENGECEWRGSWPWCSEECGGDFGDEVLSLEGNYWNFAESGASCLAGTKKLCCKPNLYTNCDGEVFISSCQTLYDIYYANKRTRPFGCENPLATVVVREDQGTPCYDDGVSVSPAATGTLTVKKICCEAA